MHSYIFPAFRNATYVIISTPRDQRKTGKKKGAWLEQGDLLGMIPTQLKEDYVINHEIKIPESLLNQQPGFNGLYPAVFFFSWLRCLALLLAALQRDRRLAPARSSCEMVPGNFRRCVSGEFRRKTTRKCMAYANIFLNITCMLGECQCDITWWISYCPFGSFVILNPSHPEIYK